MGFDVLGSVLHRLAEGGDPTRRALRILLLAEPTATRSGRIAVLAVLLLVLLLVVTLRRLEGPVEEIVALVQGVPALRRGVERAVALSEVRGLGERRFVLALAVLAALLFLIGQVVHAGDLRERPVHLVDPAVELLGEADALLEKAVHTIGAIRRMGKELPQVGVLADDARALLGQRGGLFQANLHLAGDAQTLLEGVVYRAQLGVAARDDADAPLFERSAAGDGLLQARHRLLHASAVPGMMVQLGVVDAVLFGLELRDVLQSALAAADQLLAGGHLRVGLGRVLHARHVQALVEIAAVRGQLVGGGLAVHERLGKLVVALASPVTDLPDELPDGVVAQQAGQLGRVLLHLLQHALRLAADADGFVEHVLRLGRFAAHPDTALDGLAADLLQAAHGALRAGLGHELFQTAQRDAGLAAFHEDPLALGELAAVEQLPRGGDALHFAERLERTGAEVGEPAAAGAFDRVLPVAARRDGADGAGERADAYLGERSQFDKWQRAGERAGACGEQNALPILALGDGGDGANARADERLHHQPAGDERRSQRETGDEQLALRALEEPAHRLARGLDARPRLAGGALGSVRNFGEAARLDEAVALPDGVPERGVLGGLAEQRDAPPEHAAHRPHHARLVHPLDSLVTLPLRALADLAPHPGRPALVEVDALHRDVPDGAPAALHAAPHGAACAPARVPQAARSVRAGVAHAHSGLSHIGEVRDGPVARSRAGDGRAADAAPDGPRRHRRGRTWGAGGAAQRAAPMPAALDGPQAGRVAVLHQRVERAQRVEQRVLSARLQEMRSGLPHRQPDPALGPLAERGQHAARGEVRRLALGVFAEHFRQRRRCRVRLRRLRSGGALLPAHLGGLDQDLQRPVRGGALGEEPADLLRLAPPGGGLELLLQRPVERASRGGQGRHRPARLHAADLRQRVLVDLPQRGAEVRLGGVAQQLVEPGVVSAQRLELSLAQHLRRGHLLQRPLLRRRRAGAAARLGRDSRHLGAALIEQLLERMDVRRAARARGDGAHVGEDLADLPCAPDHRVARGSVQPRQHGVKARQLSAQRCRVRIGQRSVRRRGEVRKGLLEAVRHAVAVVMLALEDAVEVVAVPPALVGAREDLLRRVLHHLRDGRREVLAQDAQLGGHQRRRVLRRLPGVVDAQRVRLDDGSVRPHARLRLLMDLPGSAARS